MNTTTAPFQKHSRTSRKAAEQLQSAPSMSGDILMYLEAYPSGFTADELQDCMAKKHPGAQAGTYAARLRDLQVAGKIVKTTEERTTRSGRQANVWKSKANASKSEILPAKTAVIQTDADRYHKALEDIRAYMKTNGYGKDMKPVMEIVDGVLTGKP